MQCRRFIGKVLTDNSPKRANKPTGGAGQNPKSPKQAELKTRAKIPKELHGCKWSARSHSQGRHVLQNQMLMGGDKLLCDKLA